MNFQVYQGCGLYPNQAVQLTLPTSFPSMRTTKKKSMELMEEGTDCIRIRIIYKTLLSLFPYTPRYTEPNNEERSYPSSSESCSESGSASGSELGSESDSESGSESEPRPP